MQSNRSPVLSSVAALFCTLLLIGAGAEDASGQSRQISLEVNPIHGTVGYGWHRSPDRIVGIEVGFGFPQLDRTLVPADGSFEDLMHIGAFVRTRPASSITLSGSARIGLADLRSLSDLPGGLASVSGGVFWGGRSVKVGPRVTAGVINELRTPAEFIVNLTPVAVLFTHSW